MDAHLRMVLRMTWPALVNAHELNFEYALMLWSQLNMDLEQVLMLVGMGRTTSSRAIFCNGSMLLMYPKDLHAKERLKELNNNVNKLNWGCLWRRLNYMMGWSAMERRLNDDPSLQDWSDVDSDDGETEEADGGGGGGD